LGCFDPRNQKVTADVLKILQKANISFGLLKEEKCTGDLARRVGREDLFQDLASQNIEVLKQYAGKKIITQCPHCFNTLKNEYPDFGGTFEVLHYTQVLEQIIQSKKITLSKEIKQRIAYHDSCYLGRHNNIYMPPRNVLQAIPAATILEMPRTKNKSFCCGGGGGMMFAEEKEGTRVNVERIKEVSSTNPEVLVSNCPFCLSMFEDAIKTTQEKFKAKDLAEVIVEAME
jgi:Fe-S oxidoreductase